MPDKLTDSKIYDIKELLEYKAKVGCQNCDLIGKGCCSTCVNSLIKSFIGLFDRLQAENERLENDVITLTKSISELTGEVERQRKDKDSAFELAANIVDAEKIVVAQTKAEAYREFAERLKQRAHKCFMGTDKAVTVFNIDDLLKEFVGEQPPLNDVKCKDCEYLEFELPYAVCSKAYKGIVAPDDSCGKGKLKELVGDDDGK